MGGITAFFSFPSISFMVSASQSKPLFGNTATKAVINLNTSGTFATAGNLIIDVTDTDFNEPANPTGAGTLYSKLSENNAPANGITNHQLVSFANGGTPGGNIPFGGIAGVSASGSIYSTPVATPSNTATTTTIANLIGPYSMSMRTVFSGTPNAGFSIVNEVNFIQTTPPPVASLGDYVWHDLNANGQQDNGEPGIPNVLVTLLDSAGVSTGATQLTDSNGKYLFGNLTPGTYSVSFADLSGLGFTRTFADTGADTTDSDADKTTGKTANYTLAAGETNLTVDAGYYKPASIGDFIWEDANANGIQDNGELGVAGATVQLFNSANVQVGASQTTGANGLYLFTDLVPGDYYVKVTPPAGYFFSPQDQGGNDALDSDADTTTGKMATTMLISGEDDRTWDAGLYKLVSVGDFVWEDKNFDGFQDATELGINGVQLKLTGTDNFGSITPQLATTANKGADAGYYLFSGLRPGTYTIEIVTSTVPAGFIATQTGGGKINGPLGVDETDSNPSPTTTAFLPGGTKDLTRDFGFYKLSQLGDYVWNDLNKNGIQDSGEPGIDGVQVVLTGTDFKGGAVNKVTVTAGGGLYLFDNLFPGSYQVTFPTISGFVRTVADAGSNDGTDSDANVDTGVTGVYTLGYNESNLTVDAGYVIAAPGIDVEKTTNGPSNSNSTAPDYDNEDAPNGPGVPVLIPGSTVTWTYKVTNTGNVAFTKNDITLVDDNGTATIGDDLSFANGAITFLSYSVGDTDNLLEPGEVWLYTASGVVQNLATPGASSTVDFSGSTATSGTAGNIRPYTVGGVSVNVSGFSRDKATGEWATAFLGAYSGGLGVTDSSEGDGSSNRHTVDNDGRDNYVLFEFSENVIIDSVFLGYIVGDSDLTAWIGTIPDTFASHTILNDTVLASLGFSEVNVSTATGTRTANLNAGNVAGNVLVIAAKTGESDDKFKIEKLTVNKVQPGTYENKATVTAPNTPSDSDLSHYKNPTAQIDIEKYVKEVTVVGGEGLTPGYWKQTQHFPTWVPTGYTQSQSFNTVFGVNDPDNPTLLQALQTGGGGFNALGRHAVAALLNASHPTIEYAFTAAQVIAKVQSAYANPTTVEAIKNELAAENERGADLSSDTGTATDPNPSNPGSDADVPQGLVLQTGSQIVFTFIVTNPGAVALSDVVVVDDNQTPNDPSDDFNPTPVLSDGFNVGDTDKDNQLDVGEAWKYTYGPITVTAGQHTNNATVSGTPVGGGSSVTDNDPANWFGTSSGETSIRGQKLRDVSGNGLNLTATNYSPADVPLAGVVVYLDDNNNNILDSGESWMTTGSDGSFAFLNLTPGDYIVREVVPADYIRTYPILQNFHAVTLASGQSVDGLFFANFEKCEPNTISNVYFKIYNPDGSYRTQVTDLRNNVNPGDRVKAYFTVNPGHDEVVSLVSYTAPESYFNANTASQQTIFDIDSGLFSPGSYVLEVVVPNSNFQIDLVCGPAIEQLGPAGSNIFYTPQMRLISADNDGNFAPSTVSKLSGFVYVDDNNNGIKESSETGIAGVTVQLTGTDYLGNVVNLTATTSTNGSYSFTNLKMSDRFGYRISEVQPDNYLDGKDALGSAGGLLHNDFVDEILLGANVDGVGYNFGERSNGTSVGSLSGYVYVDVDDDGLREINESGIVDVVVKLFKLDGSNWVFVSETATDEDGYYQFVDLAPATYRIVESQPEGFLDGKERAGTLGGSIAVNDTISTINLGSGQAGINYNFGEVGVSLRSGMTATIGFWKNKNGQKIIESLGNTSSGKSLGNWLAENFPNLYGSLAGKSNSYIADYFVTLFNNNGAKTEAQVMATVLSVFVTDTRLNTSSYARSLAQKHGFRLSGTASTGNALFNVGINGAAFGLDDSAWTTVWELVKRVDAKASNGLVFQSDRIQVNNVFTRINELGDIK
jgi:hypothetical protein